MIVYDERALATVEVISELTAIPDADFIEVARVRNWNVVVKKGHHKVGDLVVFFEVDSALPVKDVRFEHLEPRGVKLSEIGYVHVLKTVRLRGAYSQGMVIPVDCFLEIVNPQPGDDVTKVIGIGKWEDEVVQGGNAGSFTSQYAAKTDSERAQNFNERTWADICQHQWQATEKVDGSSCTIIRDEDGVIRVNSRNFEVKRGDNIYWSAACMNSDVLNALNNGDAVQCEVVGPGVQKNRQGFKQLRIVVFNYLRNATPQPREMWPQPMLDLAAPVLDIEFPASPTDAVAQVEGMTTVLGEKGRQAEGVVWHTVDGSVVTSLGRSTWKAINNKYLLKG